MVLGNQPELRHLGRTPRRKVSMSASLVHSIIQHGGPGFVRKPALRPDRRSN